ncbi:hypothetical protein H310_14985 [Aphanomyces invadans]|uniref:Uncharacterized protein n=1 Tax=Aphanomyces invadans TaxID=157072 RepID=A0A024T878_9STRA|nr:hypothetical protein H310_14985 [Aphanomyces invadans]ETV90188.1 hypothetical protein H310_14985 [Aphanomyces invadans]|eukprot:XP_008881187.1 hypothetical protein H310_14985 [Aphanomyces invadans]
MAELQPVLDLLATGTASGGELFDAFEPLRRDSNATSLDISIDEGKTLNVVLFDNHQANVDSASIALMQLRKNMSNQQLVLGLASFLRAKRRH